MNIVKAARAAMDMSQSEFSKWLSDEVGRNAPLPISRISEWESGKRSPRKNVRDACLPVVAGEIASDAVMQVCALLKCTGVAPLDIAMSDDAMEVKNAIKDMIIENTR